MSSRRKKGSGWQTFLSVLVAAVLVFYVGYQAYRSIFEGVTTEMAVMHSVYESIKTDGLVFRSETIIPENKKGNCYYTIENGTRVSKDSVIASVYQNENSGRIEQQIQEIDAQIAALKDIQSDGSSGHITLDIINEQLSAAEYGLIQAVNTGELDRIPSLRFTLLSLLSKKQLVTGKKIDFADKIRKLETERNNLKRGFQKATSVVKAPVAGYFANRTDGYETKLTINKLDKLTVKQLDSYMKDESSKPTASSGKIVSGYEWYMACIVPDSYYNVLGVGTELSLRMSFVLDESVPVTVHACQKDGNGKMAVVFRCDYMSEELSTIRKEMVEIQLIKHTGLKVPKRAIVVDKHQQAGVYVRSGNVASFRKIEQKFSEPAEYVICREVNEPGYLRMYDDIIVGGRGLYDGKIIR